MDRVRLAGFRFSLQYAQNLGCGRGSVLPHLVRRLASMRAAMTARHIQERPVVVN